MNSQTNPIHNCFFSLQRINHFHQHQQRQVRQHQQLIQTQAQHLVQRALLHVKCVVIKHQVILSFSLLSNQR